MHIGYVGNFGPAHSTENHVATDAEALGHRVTRLQENTTETWSIDPAEFELLLWTRTGWDWPKAVGWTLEQAHAAQRDLLARAARAGTPTVGLHLDRWFGLDRQGQVDVEPFFEVDLLYTADGGHDDEWARRSIDHRWMPPAISAVEARREGRVLSQYRADVAFVGNWSRYHAEYPQRRELVGSLRNHYRNRFKAWPRGSRAVRGQDLADLYRTAKVIVGDSCLAPATDGEPIRRYWSDRIPETLGRGGFLLHPWVDGIDEQFVDGLHLRLYHDRRELVSLIDEYLADGDARRSIADAGRDHVREHHTYENRIEQIVNDVIGTTGSTGTVRARRGRLAATFEIREGSSDTIVIDEIWREDVYKLDRADLAGRTVVDLGANVGAFSIFAALAGAQCVHAYEPDAANQQALATNIKANALEQQILVSPEAVTDGTETQVEWCSGDLGSEGGSQRARQPSDVVVPAIGLDEVVARAGHVGVLKMDVEGAESSIICGAARETLERIDRIVMEFHGAGTGGSMTEDEWTGMVHTLAELGHVRILGRPSVGGSIWWERYG